MFSIEEAYQAKQMAEYLEARSSALKQDSQRILDALVRLSRYAPSYKDVKFIREVAAEFRTVAGSEL